MFEITTVSDDARGCFEMIYFVHDEGAEVEKVFS